MAEAMKAPRCQGEICDCCGASAEIVARGFAERIANRYGYTLTELRREDRRREVVTVRRMVTCVLRGAGFSLPVIAGVLHRDHTTVLHTLRQVDAAIEAGVDQALPKMPHSIGAAA